MKEKKEKVGITEVSNKLVLQAHEKIEDFPEKEFRYLSEKYWVLLFDKATKSKRNVKMPVLKAEAITVCLLSLFSAKALGKDFKKIKKVDEMINIIHQATGIQEIENWLKIEKGDAEAILQTSGVDSFYKNLFNLSFTDQTINLIKSLDEFKKTVSEVFDWLKLVKILNNRSKVGGTGDKFVSDFHKFHAWDQNKIYYTFIIGITLDTGSSVFSLNDLLKFCLTIQDKNWITNFEAKLSMFSKENDAIAKIYDNGAFKNIINSLKVPKNQNLAYFLRRVNIVRGDFKLMNDFVRIVDKSLIYAKRQLFLEKEGDATKYDIESIKNKLLHVTKQHKAEGVYKILVERPYFIFWFSREEITRMLIIDAKNNNELQSKIEDYVSKKDLVEILELLNSKVSVADVLHMLLRDEKIFDHPFRFFSDNRTRKLTLQFNSVQSFRLLKSMIYTLGKETSFRQFSLWLAEVDQKKGILPLDRVDVSKLTAQLFLMKEGTVSENVLACLRKYPWFAYMTPEIIRSIRERIK